jgi:hypothetical protein
MRSQEAKARSRAITSVPTRQVRSFIHASARGGIRPDERNIVVDPSLPLRQNAA